MPIPILAVVVSAIVFAPLCSWLALRNERSAGLWFVFGILLGPLAAALLIAAPPGRCPACGTRSSGWPRQCAGCGLEFAPASRPSVADAEHPRAAAAAIERGPSVVPRGPTGAAAREAAASDSTREPRAGARRSPTTSAPRSSGEGLADLPGRRSATVLGRRPTALAAPPAAPTTRRSGPTVAILGSGIFMGGTEPLQIGSRYLIARVGTQMHCLGPMHISPSAVAARIHLGDTQATVVADRLLLTGRSGNSGPTLAFSSVSAEPGVDFTEALRSRARRKAAAT